MLSWASACWRCSACDFWTRTPTRHTPEGVKLLEQLEPSTQEADEVLRGVEAALGAGVSRACFPAWYERHFRTQGTGSNGVKKIHGRSSGYSNVANLQSATDRVAASMDATFKARNDAFEKDRRARAHCARSRRPVPSS